MKADEALAISKFKEAKEKGLILKKQQKESERKKEQADSLYPGMMKSIYSQIKKYAEKGERSYSFGKPDNEILDGYICTDLGMNGYKIEHSAHTMDDDGTEGRWITASW